MEIISYVQAQPRSKFNLPSFERKLPKLPKIKHHREKSTFSYNMYTQELNGFTISKVRHQITLRSVITAIGHCVTLTEEFISKNISKLLIIFLSMLIFAGIFSGSAYLINHHLNFTGPIPIKDADIENLNKLMDTFALEGWEEIDDTGKLLSQEISVSAKNYSQAVSYQIYKVRSGDTISGIAKKFGLTNISTLISVNDIGNVRTLAAGQKLKIPSMDGIVYTVKAGDTIDAIVKKYGVKLNTLLDVNELTSENLYKGQQLFLPGASLDQRTLKEAMGDKFILPIQAKFRWSSPYGKRIDPIANVSSFHTGTDMACPTGTPIVAAMSGKISAAGVNRIYGNFVIIDHGNGYQTLYAHMSKIIATKGQWVSQGTRIGLVGSTGYSTGPHLHFTVYKNGQMINPMSVLK